MRHDAGFERWLPGGRRLAALVFAVAACSDGDGGEAESESEAEAESEAESEAECDAPGGWAVVGDELDRVPRSVFGFSADDVWVSGGWPSVGALALHFDGETWEDRSPESDATLWWVWGCAPDDVWFVGSGGAAFRWEGDSMDEYDSDTTATLFGVWGAACDDLWAVGGSPMGGAQDVITHFDGDAWTVEPALTLCEDDAGAPEPCGVPYFKVWGSAADDVFVVGPGGLIVHYAGSKWTQMASGVMGTLFTVWGSGPDDVWAVGGQSGPAVAVRWDGQVWGTVPVDWMSCGPFLQGVSVEGNRDVWITGLSGMKFRYEAACDRWFDDCLMDPLTDLHAVWAPGDGTAYAVGGNYLSETAGGPGDGVVAHFGVEHPPALP